MIQKLAVASGRTQRQRAQDVDRVSCYSELRTSKGSRAVFTPGISGGGKTKPADLKHSSNVISTAGNEPAVVEKIAQAVHGDD